MSCTVVFNGILPAYYVLSRQNTRKGTKCPIGTGVMYMPLTNENSWDLLSHLHTLPFFPFAPGRNRHRRKGHRAACTTHPAWTCLIHHRARKFDQEASIELIHPVPKKSQLTFNFRGKTPPITFSMAYTKPESHREKHTHKWPNQQQIILITAHKSSLSPVFGQTNYHPQ
jgi:hypothetical protein